MPDETIDTHEATDAFGHLPDGAPAELPVEPPAAVEPAAAMEAEQPAAQADPGPQYEPQAGTEDYEADDPFAGMTMEEIEDAFEEFVDEEGPLAAAQALAALAVQAQQAEMQEQSEERQPRVRGGGRTSWHPLGDEGRQADVFTRSTTGSRRRSSPEARPGARRETAWPYGPRVHVPGLHPTRRAGRRNPRRRPVLPTPGLTKRPQVRTGPTT